MARPGEAQLREDMGRFATDPHGFVKYAFPWGEGELVDYTGPDEWATKVLVEMRDRLQAGDSLDDVIRIAVASGHGIGKSALMGWIVLWCLCTMEDSLGVITANTEQQLRTKTWPQVTKWYNLCIAKHWFELTDTSLYSTAPGHEKTWRFDRVTWSANNTDAFAGLHNLGRRVVLLFDEASSIADKVWEVAEGALTDVGTQIIWIAFGNPTKNQGRFFECFNRFRARWFRLQVDSRTVKITNKKQIGQWIDDYGEESDFVKVRVRGIFPARSSNQLIATEDVDAAMKREAVALVTDPLILSVDVARFGVDQSVIRRRRGRDARTWPAVKLRGADGVLVAQHVMRLCKEHEGRGEVVDAIFIDETGGWGGSPIDHLRYMGFDVVGVNFAAASPKPGFANMRMYIWAEMRAWIREGGALPEDEDLKTDLVNQTYDFAGAKDGGAMILTSKEAMKLDGFDSPDDGDALAISFAFPVISRALRRREAMEDARLDRLTQKRGESGRQDSDWDYDPLANA